MLETKEVPIQKNTWSLITSRLYFGNLEASRVPIKTHCICNYSPPLFYLGD